MNHELKAQSAEHRAQGKSSPRSTLHAQRSTLNAHPYFPLAPGHTQ
jgi:hypothetical protein